MNEKLNQYLNGVVAPYDGVKAWLQLCSGVACRLASCVFVEIYYQNNRY